jgi:hypothetical protein
MTSNGKPQFNKENSGYEIPNQNIRQPNMQSPQHQQQPQYIQHQHQLNKPNYNFINHQQAQQATHNPQQQNIVQMRNNPNLNNQY